MVALSSLNLTVNRGDLFGFIGSNGAGKTTTLPMKQLVCSLILSRIATQF